MIQLRLLCMTLAATTLLLSGCIDRGKAEDRLAHINQDPAHYLTPGQTEIRLSSAQQQHLTQDFLTHYFLPWDATQGSTAATNDVAQKMRADFDRYLDYPGWGATLTPMPRSFIESLRDNADLQHYPTINQPGIIVHPVAVRALPTLLPSFDDPKQAGQGYPFDNFEVSFLAQGAPIRILHQSQDKLWYLISSDSYYGWIPSQDAGLASAAFQQQWRAHPYVVATKDNVPLYADNGRALTAMRIGVLYPLTGEQNRNYRILLPFSDANGDAYSTTLSVDTNAAHSFPMPLSRNNIATLAQHFIGSSYGWGGLYQLRDCSATTKDLFANFAVWLPRNSLQQSGIGKTISLRGLSAQKKQQIIAEQGIPFVSLLYSPGHITLYLGMHGGQPYVLQNMWGIHTHMLGHDGRTVIGRAVITPIDFGAGFADVNETLLDTVNSMSVLVTS